MKYQFSAIFLGSAIALAGCGGTVNDGPGGGGQAGTAGSAGSAGTAGAGGSGGAAGSGGTAGAGGMEPVPGEQSLTFGPVKIKSGQENTQCIQARLKNLDILRAHKIHNVLGEGSHHMIVYRTNDTQEKLVPYDCQPFTDTLDPTKGSPLMITQKHDEVLTLPDGVAFSLDPNQMIRLEVHFINATANDIDMTASTTFIPIEEKDFKFEAGLLFLGDPDINIPAMSTFTLGPVFLPLGKILPEIADNTKFFALTGHEHQWGTNVHIAVANDKNDPGTPLYEVPNWSWAEPATVTLDPEITLPSTGGFRFSCDWDNKSASQVKFGESANDEMCFFWAYYYPSKGAFVCAHTDKFGSYDLCCPGQAICDQLF